MENYNDQNEFKYTYSAKEQAELKRIREKYTNKEENKMERLRRLDTRVTQKAQAVSLIFGVVGAMVLGFGMSLIMSDLALILGFKGAMAIIFGVISGIIGGVLVQGGIDIFLLGGACCLFSFGSTGGSGSRNKHRCQNGDTRDTDNKFDQSKLFHFQKSFL